MAMVYSDQYYTGCTEQSTSGWCATSAYQNTKGYYSYKYCTEDDWNTYGYGASAHDSDSNTGNSGEATTVTGEYCVPMTYGGVYYEACTSDTYSW